MSGPGSLELVSLPSAENGCSAPHKETLLAGNLAVDQQPHSAQCTPHRFPVLSRPPVPHGDPAGTNLSGLGAALPLLQPGPASLSWSRVVPKFLCLLCCAAHCTAVSVAASLKLCRNCRVRRYQDLLRVAVPLTAEHLTPE